MILPAPKTPRSVISNSVNNSCIFLDGSRLETVRRRARDHASVNNRMPFTRRTWRNSFFTATFFSSYFQQEIRKTSTILNSPFEPAWRKVQCRSSCTSCSSWIIVVTSAHLEKWPPAQQCWRRAGQAGYPNFLRCGWRALQRSESYEACIVFLLSKHAGWRCLLPRM